MQVGGMGMTQIRQEKQGTPHPAGTSSDELRATIAHLGRRRLTDHPTLERVMRDLGSDLLQSLSACPDGSAAVGGVVIYDPADDGEFPAGAIIIGVGVHDSAAATEVLRRMADRKPVALVVRLPFDLDDLLLAETDALQVTLLGLPQGATWHQLTTLLGVALADPADDGMSPETIGGFTSGDLFGLAGAICELIDAPVTIEDRNSNVLAFSDRQDEADFIRIETILDRHVPQAYSHEDELRGALRAIRQSDRPVFLGAIDIADDRESMPRVAVAVRAGDEFLGTVWAAVRGPLSEEKDQMLLDASRLVALHMLQLRAGADLAQRMQADLVAKALEGGPEAGAALARLGLDDHPLVVVALVTQKESRAGVPEEPYALARLAAESLRTASAVALHMSATWSGSVVAHLDGTIYVIVPAGRHERDATNIEMTCSRFLQRRVGQTAMYVGIGRVVSVGRELPLSRLDAERAVRVLRSMHSRRSVVLAADVEIESLILELRDLVASTGRVPTGAYARVIEHDRMRKTSMVETLRSWLEAHGDITDAAAASHVHQNTFRYRLKRLAEIGGVDLDDPRERFALDLQLKVFPPHDLE